MISPVSGLALDKQVSTVEQLADCYGSWEGIRTNHVVSATGSFFDESGSSRGLSTPEDLALMLNLRRICDLLIVDAATARAEHYKRPAKGQLAIISSSGDFSGIPAANQPDGVILFSPRLTEQAKNQVSRHETVNADFPFNSVIEWATEQGLRSLLLEAGPTLTKVCFAEKLVVESALTVTPRLSNSALQELRNPFNPVAELVSVAEATTATFTLWRH